MKRLEVEPRANWEQHLLNDLDFTYHTLTGEEDEEPVPYWNEHAVYEFSEKQILEIEKAANFCWQAFQEVVGDLIEKDQLHRLDLPPRAHALIKNSWNNDEKSIIGRFDFSYDGINPPKLLEFNGDTPTSLLEASIIQWDSKVQRYGESKEKADQFNLIHETLEASWKYMHDECNVKTCHFTSDHNREDISNAVYSQKVAESQGIKCHYLPTQEIGFDPDLNELYGLDKEKISTLYKLWPYEYMMEEAPDILEAVQHNTTIIEPIWKFAMSTKAALPLLHEYNPDSPYILKCYRTEQEASKNLGDTFVKKPLISREGANVTLVENGKVICEEGGDFGKEGFIYQEMAKLPDFKDSRDNLDYNPVIGVWVIGGEICGMGIRESNGLITGNTSYFVPHIFRSNRPGG